MSQTQPAQETVRERGLLSPLWLAAFFAAVSLVAVSRQSFWIDEAVTAWYATQRTLSDWWGVMVHTKFAELQTPLYMLYIWGYEKVFGASEYALRLAGVPWFIPGAVAFVTAFSAQARRRAAAVLVLALSPFVWYYLDEARLYAAQIGASCLVFAAVRRLHQLRSGAAAGEVGWLCVFALGLVVLCGLSMLGMIWASAALAAVWILFPREQLRTWWRSRRFLWLVTGGVLFGLGIYYLWTLTTGARATAAAATNWQSVVFILYEQLGFSGLGPGRQELRGAGWRALKPFFPVLGLYAAVVGVLLAAAAREVFRRNTRSTAGWLLLCLSLPTVFLLVVGVAAHFRVLGRHFAPLITVWLFLLSVGISTSWRQRGWLAKVAAGGFVAFTLWSSLSLRFADRHAKDNYREAAARGKQALAYGETVWWNADKHGAWYYGLATTEDPHQKTQALRLMNPSPERLETAPGPDLIVASKPDVYDNQGAVAAYIAQNRFLKSATPPAFTIWRRRSD